MPSEMKFYAPQVRLVDQQTGESIGGDSPADADLISAKVVQLNSGISTVSLTINNQRHDNARPVYPPWKYNDLDRLRFGQRIRVDFRYGVENWVPMILARVTDMSFSFPQSGGSKITVQGEDLLSLLKRKDARDKRYRNQQELDIVRSVLERSHMGLPMGAAVVPALTFDDTLGTVMHQKRQTYLKFLEDIADRLDYEVFVDFDEPRTTSSAVKFHFEGSRSLALGKVIDLTWGENLTQFNPKFKVWEQITAANASGRHPRNRRRVSVTAGVEAIAPDLHAEQGKPAPLNAIDARRRFFEDESRSGAGDAEAAGGDNPEAVDVTNLDEGRARAKATAVVRTRAREFLTVEGGTIGFPSLRPGLHVNIREMRAPFDGLYYVTKATHSLDQSGYKTSFSLRRPGMLPPENYLTAEATP